MQHCAEQWLDAVSLKAGTSLCLDQEIEYLL